MKNVERARVNFLQIDHEIKRILELKGIEVLPVVEAWKKYNWVKEYLKEKPKEGYFIWVKKQIDFPISSGVYVSANNITQKMFNLIVIEPSIKVKAFSFCGSLKNSNGIHTANGIVILKENSYLEILNLHSWSKRNKVRICYKHFLKKNATMKYIFKNLKSPREAEYFTKVFLEKNSNAKLRTVVDAVKSEITLEEEVFLKGKGSSSTVEIRAVGRKEAKIKGFTKAVAEAEGRAHIDCEGLLIDKKSEIRLVPELYVKNKHAVLTHEASIGKIADEQLYYLRSRGLSEKEAIDLIVSGFLRS